uniref:Uncharacterized protein n=1 Tax=Pseudo-nitzschia australis TaxID=44445 RepID=A0A7S4EI78_9STRA|mmetsp:Transcript_12417/g.26166  ORF Transcript_12417/g.26166 Transcript_12417/m.26166 type:complete len:290 (+) Transcript_12417:197-1066(+)|eukprot:CAMPEP_0168186084 /NCGR_PEP_ID=MMETSP0139_2-20121125/14221_1 /TAXON_ID=44445 /ORGANISM="Pseudo-nitzschia australis, Strain 10249 10 AB" /LENGTH=289 /DNA_ID=CAMNT_0008108023 /DNA_START=138 /DNA_END=1007 /DNA_ORIENTATION=-
MYSIDRGKSVANEESLSSYLRGCEHPRRSFRTNNSVSEQSGGDFVPKTQCSSLEEFIRSLRVKDSKIGGEEESTPPPVIESSSSELGDSSVDDCEESTWSSASTNYSESTVSEGGDSESTVSEATVSEEIVSEATDLFNSKPIEDCKNEMPKPKKTIIKSKAPSRYERPNDFLPLQSPRGANILEKKVMVSDTTNAKKRLGSRVQNRRNTLHMSLDLASTLKDSDLHMSLDLSHARMKYGDSVEVSDFGTRAFNRPDDWVGGSARMMGPKKRSWRPKGTIARSDSNKFF